MRELVVSIQQREKNAPNFETYLRKKAQTGCWANQDDLTLACLVFNVSIVSISNHYSGMQAYYADLFLSDCVNHNPGQLLKPAFSHTKRSFVSDLALARIVSNISVCAIGLSKSDTILAVVSSIAVSFTVPAPMLEISVTVFPLEQRRKERCCHLDFHRHNAVSTTLAVAYSLLLCLHCSD
jgi:hypothetical protein